jgi:hypothetical protein
MNKPDFKKLLKRHNPHSTFLDENGVIEALNESYLMGKKQSQGDYSQLKTAFETLLQEYAYSCRHKKATTLVIEDWEKKAGIY